MNVARRNRSWTPELCDKLYREVTTSVKDGNTASETFKKLSNAYGASPDTLSTMFYKIRHRKNAENGAKSTTRTSRAVMAFAAPKSGKQVTTPDISDAIALLKKMGANVTISF